MYILDVSLRLRDLSLNVGDGTSVNSRKALLLTGDTDDIRLSFAKLSRFLKEKEGKNDPDYNSKR